MRHAKYIIIALLCIFISNTSSAYLRELKSDVANHLEIKKSLEKQKMSVKGNGTANNLFKRMKSEMGNRNLYLVCLPSCENNTSEISYNMELTTSLSFLDEICRQADLYWKIVPGKILVGSKNEIMMDCTIIQEPQQTEIFNNTWATINYPPIECPWSYDKTTRPVINSKDTLWIGKKPELLLYFYIGRRKTNIGQANQNNDLTSQAEDDSVWEGKYPQPGDISASIYYENGTKVESLESQPTVSYVSGRINSQSGLVQCHFPWGENIVEDAWTRLTFLDKHFWLDLPYGFTRPYGLKSCSPNKNTDIQQKLSDIEQFNSIDKEVRWESVSYDMIELEDGSHIELTIKNSNPVIFEVLLYSERIGNSGGWHLDSPVTSFNIEFPDEKIIKGQKKPSERPDRYRRLDTFSLPESITKKGRYWCTISIKIDARTLKYTVPSSMIQR